MVVRSPASVVSNGGIIAATTATLHEFSDRQLYGGNVGFCNALGGCAVPSHRLVCPARHPSMAQAMDAFKAKPESNRFEMRDKALLALLCLPAFASAQRRRSSSGM